MICSVCKFKPIARFACLLERDLKLGYKILFALRVLCLVDICADRCSASADLISDNRFVIRFQIFDKIYDINGKFHR